MKVRNMGKEKLKERARDELFSHINRCGVLTAEVEDQRTWMEETIEYIGERYPDLTDADLQELRQVGMRFCKPAIPHGSDNAEPSSEDANAA
jgi:hypothetical protein